MPSIKQDLTNRSESVERVYGFNAENRFLVNRRYQRKLVWSIDEKRAFIDSLQQGLPVPLILLADVVHDGESRFEIIDGMQRLNAITSFIEGEFDLDGYYFDLEAMAQTKLLSDQGKLTQHDPRLAREVCVKIVSYSLPLTVYPVAEHTEIDEIFRRINAYGKHLSRQELRVAGVTTAFSRLVRNLAARVRGDVSASDKLYLSAMKQISITSKELPYGINVDNIFWVQNNILTREYIRQSRDEELIADMLGYVLLTPKLSSSAEIIDEFFGYSPTAAKQARRDEVEAAVNKIGSEVIAGQYMAVHEAFREIVKASGKRFNDLMFEEAGQRVPRYFQSVFLALWELLVNDQMVMRDFSKAAEALDGAGKNISIGGGGGRFSAEDREKNVNVVKGLLRPACSKRKQSDPALSSWTTELENVLMQSYTEQALYDFKQGLMLLDGSNKVDEAVYEKVFKTLAAMANHGPGATGYVIIGVADDEKTAARITKLFGLKPPVKYQRFLITGIDYEARLLPKGLDSYFLGLTQRLAAAQMTQWAKDQIARDVRLISYFGRHLVVLKVESGREPCDFQGKYYERHGPNVSEVPQSQYTTLFRRFLAAKA
jgi:hypothetical protein